MAYRDEVEGSCLLECSLVATLRVWEGKHLYDWQETQLVSTWCKEYSTYSTGYLRGGPGPVVVLPIVEQWHVWMGLYRTITTKGIMPLPETCDTTVQSGPYKLGLWCTWNASIISLWPVPELTGVQWVEPLPQAGYITLLLEGTSTSCCPPPSPLSCYLWFEMLDPHWLNLLCHLHGDKMVLAHLLGWLRCCKVCIHQVRFCL